jgi:SMI1 / KNR4 family (SUKH-1)
MPSLDMLRDRAIALRVRIAALRAGDPSLRRFGAREHGYALGPTLDEPALARLEGLVGAPLPEDYHAWLAHGGDGGAGPYYGFLTVSEGLARRQERHDTLAGLGRDCALEADASFAELAPQEPTWSAHVARLQRDAAYAKRFDDLAAAYADPRFDDGTLPICDYGCGDVFFLVLRGARRGTVWVDSLDSKTGLYCLEVGILDFVERWVAECEAQAEPGPLASSRGAFGFLALGASPRRPAC